MEIGKPGSLFVAGHWGGPVWRGKEAGFRDYFPRIMPGVAMTVGGGLETFYP